MASVRDLKKDIDLILSLALSDCFYVLEYNQKVDEKAVYEIAGEIVQKHRELRLRAIHPDGKDNPKLVKRYYKTLIQDMLVAVDSSLEKLSAEIKKVAK
jgi:signal recognition particle subunit SEC65